MTVECPECDGETFETVHALRSHSNAKGHDWSESIVPRLNDYDDSDDSNEEAKSSQSVAEASEKPPSDESDESDGGSKNESSQRATEASDKQGSGSADTDELKDAQRRMAEESTSDDPESSQSVAEPSEKTGIPIPVDTTTLTIVGAVVVVGGLLYLWVSSSGSGDGDDSVEPVDDGDQEGSADEPETALFNEGEL